MRSCCKKQNVWGTKQLVPKPVQLLKRLGLCITCDVCCKWQECMSKQCQVCGVLHNNWFPSQCSCCKDFLCRFGTLYNSNWLCGLQNLIGIQTFLFLRALGGGGEKRAPVWSLPVCGTSSLSSFLSTCWAWSKRKLEETYVVHCWYLYRNVTKILMKKSKRIHYSFW